MAAVPAGDNLGETPLLLGDGVFSPDLPVFTPAGECMELSSVTPTKATKPVVGTAFFAENAEDFKQRVKESVLPSSTLDGLEPGITDRANKYFLDGNGAEQKMVVVGIMMRVPTVRSDVKGSIGAATCFGPGIPGNIVEFFDICGSGWLDGELFGGYILLTAGFDQTITDEIIDEIKRAFHAGSAEYKVPTPAIVNAFLEGNGSLPGSVDPVLFNVDVFGIPLPAKEFLTTVSGPNGDEDFFDPAAWSDYANSLENGSSEYPGFQAALLAGTGYDVSYGSVIEQYFRSYDREDVEGCTADMWTPADYECLRDRWKEMGEILSGTATTPWWSGGSPSSEPDTDLVLSKVADWIRTRVENPTSYSWGSSSVDTFKNYLQDYDQCMEDLGKARQDCFNSVESKFLMHATEAFCETECQFPTFVDNKGVAVPCDIKHLGDEMRLAHEANVYPPLRFTRPPEYALDTTSTDTSLVLNENVSDHVCVVSQIGGHFKGFGEDAHLTRGSVNHELTRTTLQDTLPTIGARCVPRIRFVNGLIGTPWLAWDSAVCELDSTSTSVISPVPTMNVATEPVAVALAGMSGTFDQTAPPWSSISIGHTSGSDDWLLQCAGLTERGYSTVFGFDAVGLYSNAIQTFGPRQSGSPDLPLMPADEGLCYLTGVKGQFDEETDLVSIILGQDGVYMLRVSPPPPDPFGGTSPPGTIWATAACMKYNQTP